MRRKIVCLIEWVENNFQTFAHIFAKPQNIPGIIKLLIIPSQILFCSKIFSVSQTLNFR
jgi:hypothetical protein